MAKSVGNVLLVRDLLDEHHPEVLRFVLLSAHYRQPLDWTADGVAQAKTTLDRLYGQLREAADIEPASLADDDPDLTRFVDALADDLNTPKAFAELHGIARALGAASGNRPEQARLKAVLVAAGDMLGLLQLDPAEWFGGGTSDADAERIETMIAARQAARKAKDFAEADRIRDQLVAEGIVLMDSVTGTEWRRGG
jgi:cysteinyl-tRNA synthetase